MSVLNAGIKAWTSQLIAPIAKRKEKKHFLLQKLCFFKDNLLDF
jgi:hypothetical protein